MPNASKSSSPDVFRDARPASPNPMTAKLSVVEHGTLKINKLLKFVENRTGNC
jgi:hypothetical protein